MFVHHFWPMLSYILNRVNTTAKNQNKKTIIVPLIRLLQNLKNI